MDVELNAHEARVLGVLVEKAYTTPDQYPLSLNAATNGCNQKSNRDPRVDFSEAEVTVALTGLRMKQLVGSSFPSGGRVEKWKQSAREHLTIGDHELAVLAELLLRGPQAPGELRARASRMRRFANQEELETSLKRLLDKGYIGRLPPASGSRAERYGQRLAAHLHPDGEDAPRETSARPTAPTAPMAAPTATGGGLEERVDALEREIAALRRQLSSLAAELGGSLEER